MVTDDFCDFYSSHKTPTLKYALSLGCRLHYAEDLVQDIFLEIWLHGQRCSLRKMVRQRFTKLQRKLSKEVELDGLEPENPDTTNQSNLVDCVGSLHDQVDEKIIAWK